MSCKTIELANSLSEKIKNSYKKDIENIINVLIQDYDIYKRGSKELITKNELLNLFFNNDQIKYCSAATKSGTRCKHKAINNSNYCNKHLYSIENLKEFIHSSKLNNNENDYTEPDDFYLIEKKEEELKDYNKNNFKKILIDDAFYLIDDKWIYDKDSLEKVGYIEKNNENYNEINYILTSDPFILNFAFE